ncbi:hypothetical protein ONZ51_g5239 [Trametes cubensis]|uniref:F-box domain-containing protein n=1 Tax=Trametes cubensis TaxID=1111947 RepID=A0AAD7TUC8_9APHY|nr:hypothetical protein ONZ51_g5239 [Trametes cubensis]
MSGPTLAFKSTTPRQPLGRSLLGLAEELLVYILLELAPADLVSCTKVCHTMADVVERTPAVQYRLQLGLAGMVDGPANVAPVSKRLEQLLAYQAASRSGALPIQITSHASGGSDDWHSYRNGTYIHEHASSLTLSRPASAFTGIEKKTVGCLNYRDHIPDPDFTIGNCAVDSDQDLVVVTQLNLGEAPHMYFLSISQEGALHPLAAHPHVEGLVELGVSMDPEESLEIKGDLVAWSITTEVFQIFVYNWKTGKSVWESGDFNDDGNNFHHRPYFLDATHIVVVENMTLGIHEVHPTKPIHDSLLCELELPALATNKLPHGVQSCLQFPPAHSGEAPLFKLDPSLTLLVLRFAACNNPGQSARSNCKTFLVLVPVSTMLAQVERVHHAKAKGQVPGTSERRSSRVVPWKEWSPLGACLLEHKSLADDGYGFDISSLGSRVLISPPEITAADAKDKVCILDACPLATAMHPTPSDSAEPPILMQQCIEDPDWFAEPVHNTLPCRVVRLDPSAASESDWESLWGLTLAEDCLRGVKYCYYDSE